ncbi:MAG TPA: type VI secretion system lipoprotein TssJ [Candidatus Binatia bacterium]|nr:type VI secretion system lipoprotein TssJ [Candidatus Binatia bacterium]
MTLGGWAGAVVAGLAAAAALGSAACGRRVRPFTPSPKTFRVCIEASPRLNWYDGRAHALALRFFRLADGEAFDQADAGRLLADPAALAGAVGAPLDRTVSPGTTLSVDIPRKPALAFVGLVAAYAAGPRKLRRPAAPEGDAPAHGGAGCIRLGADAIEAP